MQEGIVKFDKGLNKINKKDTKLKNSVLLKSEKTCDHRFLK